MNIPDASRILLLTSLFALAPGCERLERTQQVLPELGLRDLDGKAIATGALRGRPWIINIWLPGCESCAHEVPGLERVREAMEPRGVGFLALSLSSDSEGASSAAARMGIKTRVVTASGEIMAPLNLNEAPSTLFVSTEGVVVGRASGSRSQDFFGKWSLALLQGKL